MSIVSFFPHMIFSFSLQPDAILAFSSGVVFLFLKRYSSVWIVRIIPHICPINTSFNSEPIPRFSPSWEVWNRVIFFVCWRKKWQLNHLYSFFLSFLFCYNKNIEMNLYFWVKKKMQLMRSARHWTRAGKCAGLQSRIRLCRNLPRPPAWNEILGRSVLHQNSSRLRGRKLRIISVKLSTVFSEMVILILDLGYTGFFLRSFI